MKKISILTCLVIMLTLVGCGTATHELMDDITRTPGTTIGSNNDSNNTFSNMTFRPGACPLDWEDYDPALDEPKMSEDFKDLGLVIGFQVRSDQALKYELVVEHPQLIVIGDTLNICETFNYTVTGDIESTNGVLSWIEVQIKPTKEYVEQKYPGRVFPFCLVDFVSWFAKYPYDYLSRRPLFEVPVPGPDNVVPPVINTLKAYLYIDGVLVLQRTYDCTVDTPVGLPYAPIP
jgi:hypothetical protein